MVGYNPTVAILELLQLLTQILEVPFKVNPGEVVEEYSPITLEIKIGRACAFDLCIAEPTEESVSEIMRLIEECEYFRDI